LFHARPHEMRLMFLRLAVGAIAAAALSAVTLALALPASAQAATSCTSYTDLWASGGHWWAKGGHVHYRKCRSGSLIKVQGYVADTDADGRCAWVQVAYKQQPLVSDNAHQCGDGTSVPFSFPWRTSTDAFVAAYTAG